MNPAPARGARADDPREAGQRLLRLIEALLRETRGAAVSVAVDLDCVLDRDLGLDSLARAELIARVEHEFGVRLPERALLVDTPRELLALVATGAPGAATLERLQGPGGGEPAPERARTLVEALDWHREAHPQRAHIYLYDEGDTPETLSYGALWAEAQGVAAGLLELGVEPGETVALMLPTGRAYFATFFGALLAGCIPVPLYPPARPSQIGEHLRRQAGILTNARCPVLVTVPEAKALARLLRSSVGSLRHVLTAADLCIHDAGITPCPRREEDTALLQYTSGSTGEPKGVVLTHANLLANIRAMGQRIGASSEDVFVSWLPLYHDMGLIGAWLGSLYYAVPLVVLSPVSFLTRPVRWLWAIHRHGGTLSASPNFGYELCLRHVGDRDLEGLDLSSWRFACNGAEPVSVDTMERFRQRFAPCGFRPEALTPVYGLAECSVGLAIPEPGRLAPVDRVRRDPFTATGRAVPAAADDADDLCFPGCGHALADHELRVVDATGRELPDRQEGQVEFRGPSATSGYLRNPEATRRLFHGQWLDTGDRGYTVDGEIYLTGRVKDLIIRGGRNFYPYELEAAVGTLPGVRRGCVAVFAATDPASGSERLVVVAETRERDAGARDALGRRIREVTVDLLGSPPETVALVAPHTVLKTSSGKIRRQAVRELYLRGGLGRGPRAVWWQLARATAAAAGPQLRRALGRAREALFAGYAWGVFGLLAAGVWLGVALLPTRRARWALCHHAGRALGRLTATPLRVSGLENLPRESGWVLVANHASYLDGYVLAAALPCSLSFVAKQELVERFSVRVLLQRLGTVFVERFDLQRSAGEAARILEQARQGHVLAFFPEGTFGRRPGLLPFRMGAFWVAAQAGLPVVPVTVRGTRSILRSDSWYPRHGAVQVIVGSPLAPRATGWEGAVALRDGARRVILRESGEPDLAR